MHFKQIAFNLASILKLQGIKKVVVSPGSRNAPLVHSLVELGLECISIVDERSAAFIALGMWQATQEPVALCCTSGSALLNYAPGIAEAYYKKAPILILSADRPEHMVDLADGQTIRQNGSLANVVKKSFTVKDTDTNSSTTILDACIAINTGISGPVHLNIHLDEPLYNETTINNVLPATTKQASNAEINSEEITYLAENISQNKKVMILCGEFPLDKTPSLEAINQLPQVVVLHEVCSNLVLKNSVESIDKTLASISSKEWGMSFAPEVLITLGNNIVSKKIKQRIRSTAKQCKHIHIGAEHIWLDTFFCLKKQINTAAQLLVENLNIKATDSTYQQLWLAKKDASASKHQAYVEKISFCDFQVFNSLHNSIPNNYNIHWSNSSVIHYAQLFTQKSSLKHFANRGVSGIDGCTSTAIGFASQAKEPTLLISGDVSFQYDINGLWNNITPNNFKIILVNNSGGNIFRIIDGPTKVNQYQTFIETQQSHTQENSAKQYGFDYFAAYNTADLKNILSTFFQLEGKALLEVFTPAEESAQALRNYFKYLENE